MKYIVIDLEMNAIAQEYVEEREHCKMEVIEIGAVLLDENYQEIGSFVTLAKPQYNTRIEKRYEKLTGIKTGMVELAPYFSEALNMFFQWCDSVSGNSQIIQWSENDYLQISREIALKNIFLSERDKGYMENSWFNLQEEYGQILGVDRNLSLKDAVMYAGKDFMGRQHDALIDARNTAELLSIVRDEVKCKKALRYVMEVLKPKRNISLGELFDFSKLSLA